MRFSRRLWAAVRPRPLLPARGGLVVSQVVALIASLMFLTSPGEAVCSLIYPVLLGVDVIDASHIRMRFGVDNQETTALTPSINSFLPVGLITPPVTFQPGFSGPLFVVTVDLNVYTSVEWQLDCQDLLVSDLAHIPPYLVNLPGPTGPPGNQGPPGPPGPANTFPASRTYRFPPEGILIIVDPHVNPTSVILLQYVGGHGGAELVVVDVGTGHFTARGSSDRQFRYVVFN